MRSKLKRVILILLDPKVFFLLIAFLLIQLWFSKNLLFGGTEVGVPTYTPGKILEQIKWIWWEALGPGVSIPTAVASIPLYFFMHILEIFGLGEIEIQKVLFFIIIYFQGLGASLVFKTTISKENKLQQVLAGLFYIFNPFMMIFVWHRFVYASFISSATLPFFIYFYLKLLEGGKIKFIFFFLLTSLLSSYMYSSVAPVIAVWLSILILYFTAVILNRQNFKKISKITFWTIILFIFWILTNLWWVYPVINTKTVLSVFSSRGNVDTLVSLSPQSTISNVVRGINPYILFFQKDWGVIYGNLLFQFLSWISVLFILFGLVKRNRSKKGWYVILLFLVGIFAAKGAAEPLGKLTAWLYANIFLLGAIRNPFEKLGLLVILPASILMSIGVNNLWSLYKVIFLRILVVVLIFGYGVYIWPMFSDSLFGSERYPPFFTIPTDYKVVSNFLSEELRVDEGKILHLPVSEGDAATYKWDYPYNGVELASHLFPGSSISRFLYISSIDQLLRETARIFHTSDYNLQKYLLSNFGIKYIILNKNLDWSSRNIDNPQSLEEILDSSPDLKVIADTENLKVYRFSAKTNPAVFSAGNITLISGTSDNASALDYTFKNLAGENGVFLQLAKGQQIPRKLLNREVIFPVRIFNSALDLDGNLETVILRPFVKHLPNVFYYTLIILKEKVEFMLTPAFEKPTKLVFFTQKRLIEAKLLKEQHKEPEFNQAILRYADYLNQAIKEIKKLEGELDTIDKITLRVVFREESETLENFLGEVSEGETKKIIEESIKKITDIRKENGFEVYYVRQVSSQPESGNINTYQFIISNEMEARVMLNLPNPQLFDLDVNKKIIIFLDGVAKEVEVKKENSSDIFSLGEINLKAGIHEIALAFDEKTEQIQTANFIKRSGTIEIEGGNDLVKMTTDKKNAWVEYLLPNYDPNKTYLLEFFYRIVKGASPQIQFWQDADSLKDNTEPKTRRALKDDFYDFDWKYFALSISANNNASIRLDRSTSNPRIRLYIPHWNNCESLNYRKYLCEDLKFRETYNKPSVVEIRDLKIAESFTGTIFLNSTFNNNNFAPHIDFRKISPVEYSVETNSDPPYLYVILNEGFHNGWKIIPESGLHFLTNGYANGWLIEKGGKQSFKIKFAPQQYLKVGIFVSLSAYMVIILLIMVKDIISGRKNSG